jgi:hypothetical protein
MTSRFTHHTLLFAGILLVPSMASAQVSIGGKTLQIHGFLQQGFAASTNNNFLTMKTTGGSFSMTDGGINVSMRITPKLRVGAQAFSRNIGDLGNGKVQIDWATVDYRFNDYFGIRAGKVKTTLGLFTDTQDMEFIHTWALLPQAVYPADLRATTIAHVGGDAYGDIGLKRAGRLSYVLYGGERPDDPRGGYYLGTRDNGTPITRYKSTVVGGDIRWLLPVEGLTVGYSYFGYRGYANGVVLRSGGVAVPVPGGIPFRADVYDGATKAFYADYQRGKFRTYSEYWLMDQTVSTGAAPSFTTQSAWYAAASYRVHEKLELGSYYSLFLENRKLDFSQTNGIRGPVVTARIDLNKYFNVKAEGHFLDGHGSPLSFRSFYPSTNPQGFKPHTTMLVLRAGFVF